MFDQLRDVLTTCVPSLSLETYILAKMYLAFSKHADKNEFLLVIIINNLLRILFSEYI